MILATGNTKNISKENREIFVNKDKRMNLLYKIKNKEGIITRYKRNKAQSHYAKNRHTFNIILKSRRLGFSTEEAIYMFDDVLFGILQEDKRRAWIDALIIGQTGDDARRIFDDKIGSTWENFPLKMMYEVDSERANMLKFSVGTNPKTKEKYTSSIQVANSGRGGGFNHVHISEFGKICADFPDRAKEIISGTIPTIPDGGRLTIESTAEGSEGYFHDMFWDAWLYQKNNPDKPLMPRQFKAHFYNWTWDTDEINRISTPLSPDDLPKEFNDYQQLHNLSQIEITYYYQKYISLGKDLNLLRQEYPTTPEEAFNASARKLFPYDQLQYQKQFESQPTHNGAWKIFEQPKPSHLYAIGADPSEGLGQDNAAAVIIDFTPTTPKVVATFLNDRTTPDLFAYELKRMGLLFNTALIAVERNNHGHATLQRLKEIYPQDQIFKEHKYTKTDLQQTERLGWNTTISTKAQMVFDFHHAIVEQAIIIPDPLLIHQLSTYERDDATTTKIKKDQKYHWDLPIAAFICFQMRTHLTNRPKVQIYIAPQTKIGYTQNGNAPTSNFNPYDPI